MFREAGALMQECGAQFLFSGEVLGERPMSQNKNALRSVEKLSGFQGRILRPLSAQLLPETIPEQQGLVDRARLLAISGRSRKPQIELARTLGITEYPEPAGGCRLTEPGYSKRLRELMDHGDALQRRDLELLAVGRHFRLPTGVKVVIGRNKKENETLHRMVGAQDVLLAVLRIPGPTALVCGAADEATLTLAASWCARYSDLPSGAQASVRVSGNGITRVLRVMGADRQTVQSCMI